MTRTSSTLLAIWIALWMAGPVPGEPPEPPAELVVQLVPRGDLALDRSAEGIDPLLEGVEVVADGPGEAVLRSQPAATEPGTAGAVLEIRWRGVEPGRWVITCTGEGVWCPSWAGGVDREGERVELPVFPRARLVGEVTVPRHRNLPDAVRVEGWVQTGPDGAARGEALTHFEQVVELGAGEPSGRAGVLELDGPAARLDLRLSARDWVPVYRWDLEPASPDSPPGQPSGTGAEVATLELGRLALRRGGSVCGFVEHSSTGSPLEGAAVHLRPAVDEQTARPDREQERLDRLAFEATTNHRGFFQIAGVPASVFRLRIEAEDLAPRTLQGVEVEADSETCFPEIPLTPYRRAEITVSPPVDPHGLPWQVQLFPVAPEPGDPLPTAAVLPDGTSVVEGIPPKAHRVQILSSRGERMAGRTEDFETVRSVHFDLDLVEVEGTVHRGDEPVEGTLTLGTGSGDQVRLDSDADGAFQGWLLRPVHGVLFVRVQSQDPPLDRSLRLEPPPVRDGVSILEIQLGERVIRGRVETPGGEAVAGAVVEVYGPDGDLRDTTTDATGSFELAGFEAGAHRLGAHHPRRGRAPWRRVEPQVGDAPAEHTLVLEPVEEQVGRLVSSTGQTVTGARIRWLSGGPLGSKGETTTDLEGRFVLPVEPAGWSVVQVAAPSEGLWSTCVTHGAEDGELLLRMPPGPPGTVELAFEEREGEGGAPRMLEDVLVFNDEGGFFNVNDLVAWRLMVGAGLPGEDGLEFPGLLPGVYGATVASGPWWVQVERACTGRLGSVGDRSALPAGGVVELTLRQP